jgi:transcriptional regulator with XRE-family HTH domain
MVKQGEIRQEEALKTFGNRVKLLRKMANFTREVLAEKIGVYFTTIRHWENNQEEEGKLASKSLKRLMTAFREMGIDCSEDWLLTGWGYPPQLVPATTIAYLPTTKAEEIYIFTSKNPSTITVEVNDLAMVPFLQIKDRVGGIWQPSQSLTHEQIAIVEYNNTLQIRMIKHTSQSGIFHLSVCNPSLHGDDRYKPIEIPLTRMAPVIRLWC